MNWKKIPAAIFTSFTCLFAPSSARWQVRDGGGDCGHGATAADCAVLAPPAAAAPLEDCVKEVHLHSDPNDRHEQDEGDDVACNWSHVSQWAASAKVTYPWVKVSGSELLCWLRMWHQQFESRLRVSGLLFRHSHHLLPFSQSLPDLPSLFRKLYSTVCFTIIVILFHVRGFLCQKVVKPQRAKMWLISEKMYPILTLKSTAPKIWPLKWSF